jgi:hypothetical protein
VVRQTEMKSVAVMLPHFVGESLALRGDHP